MEEERLFGPKHVLLALHFSIDLDYVLKVE